MEETSAEATLGACRQFVRNVRAPHRLTDNALARALLERAPRSVDPEVFLQGALDRALSRMRSRDRIIVQRCYIDAERYATVAAELGLSQRHLYRERQRALRELGQLLLRASDGSGAIGQQPCDGVSRLVQTSRSLEENGAILSAINIIESHALTTAQPLERSRLLLRLAELYSRCGSFSKALDCIRGSAELSRRESCGDALLEARLSLTRAFVAFDCGKPVEDFVRELHQTIHLIRAAGVSHDEPARGTLLARAFCLRVVAGAMSGDVSSIRTAARGLDEALGSLDRPDAEIQMRACFARALAKMYCDRDLRAAADFNWRAIDIADSAGLTLSSLELAVNLAAFYRRENQPARATAILSDRLETARAIALPHVLAALLIELGAALAEAGVRDRAQAMLDEAAELVRDSDVLQAAHLRQSANLDLQARDFLRSYERAAMAEQAYSRYGKPRLAALSMQLQAEALHSMGQRRPALSRLRGAIEILSALTQQAALARAYRTLWHISGDARHLEYSQRLATPAEPALAP